MLLFRKASPKAVPAPDATPAELAALADSSDAGLQVSVARHPNTAQDTLARLAQRSTAVQRVLLRRPGLTLPILNVLLHSQDAGVRERAWGFFDRWLEHDRFTPERFFSEQQKIRLRALNLQANRVFVKRAAASADLRSEFMRQALAFQAVEVWLAQGEQLEFTCSDLPFAYGLAVTLQVHPIIGRQELTRPVMQIEAGAQKLLDLVRQDIESATPADLIVIHRLYEALDRTWKNAEAEVSDLAAKEKAISGSIAAANQRLEQAWLWKRRPIRREIAELQAQAESLQAAAARAKNRGAALQFACGSFLEYSPLSRILLPLQNARLLGARANIPLGLASLVCHPSPRGLRRQAIFELAAAALRSSDGLSAAAPILEAIFRASEGQVLPNSHGLECILEFFVTLARGFSSPHPQLPFKTPTDRKTLTALHTYLSDLAAAARQAGSLGVDAAGPEVKRFVDAHRAFYAAESYRRLEDFLRPPPSS